MKLSVPRALVAVVVLCVVGAACRPISKPAPGPALKLFPSNALTTADPAQATGRRVNLPKPNCVVRKSDCAEITLLNQLDGFDLDPTVSIGFNTLIDVKKVTDATVYVQLGTAGPKIGLNRLVRDQATKTLYGHPKQQLAPGKQYRLVVTGAVNGQHGQSVFTTMSATVGLKKMREQLDSGQAFTDAGIDANGRKLVVDTEREPGGGQAAYPAATVAPIVGMNRTEDIGSGITKTEQVFDTTIQATAGGGTYVFGHFDAPQWLDFTTRTILTPPTGGAGPSAVRKETLGFALVTPGAPCLVPPGGWPVAIFGPGVTRSKYDAFLAADENLKKCIAVIATDPVGHAYGPASFITISRLGPPSQPTVSSHGRGVDVDADGVIGDREGVQTKGTPDKFAAIALRDGLRQTALDNMSLVRALLLDYGSGKGFPIPGTTETLSRTLGEIKYYAQSLGGIYGTMVMAIDPDLTVGALSVPGGPILEIARLSPGFRGEVGIELSRRVPPLYSCTPNPPSNSNCTTFKEQTPVYLHPPVTLVSASAIAIQQAGARANWIDRSGSPEAFAPLLLPTKKVLYQFAFGDQTVPNPPSATVMRAGKLQSVTSYYRYDQDMPFNQQHCNPHGFLLDPRISANGRMEAQKQIAEFFAAGGTTIIDPDPPGENDWEVPISSTNMLESNNFPTPPPSPTAACLPLSFP